jgi:hypothetical protein
MIASPEVVQVHSSLARCETRVAESTWQYVCGWRARLRIMQVQQVQLPKISRSDAERPLLVALRGFGLSLTVVGAVLLWPALVYYASLVMVGPTVQARIVERYYEVHPRMAAMSAEERISKEISGDIEWIYDMVGTAVLEYEDEAGTTHRFRFRCTRLSHGFYSLLDQLIPPTIFEARFPVGELSLLRRIPAGPPQYQRSPRPWVRSAYDMMLLKVDDPVEFLVRTWIGASGETVALDTSTLPGGRPILHRIGRVDHALRALPILVLGVMLTFAGLRAALFIARAPGRAEGETIRPARWWIIVVLSSPFWSQAFPSALKLFGGAWASNVVEQISNSPLALMGMFDVPIAEPPDDRPYEALRFPSQDSVYAPLWVQLALERPTRCCSDRKSVMAAAQAQVTERLDAMDADTFAAFVEDFEALQYAEHRNLDAIVMHAVEIRRSSLDTGMGD